MIREEMPPSSIREPASMKKGIAINGKEFTPVNIRWIAIPRSKEPSMSSAATEEAPKVTAIGHPIKIKMTKEPNSTVNITVPPPQAA
jgi:carbonic anhydrase